MFVMIHGGTGGGKAPRPDASGRKAVRSHAMRHFRSEQRRARQTDSREHRFIAPALPRAGRVKGPSRSSDMSNLQHEDKDHRVVQQSAAPSVEGSSLAGAASWPCNAAFDVPRRLEGAEFHRYVLAEMFGAQLLGAGMQRPRCAGILCFRRYVSTTKSDLVRASDDTICMLLPACMLPSPCILDDARKRHIVALRSMQTAIAATEHVDDIDNDLVTITGAVELLFINMFRPVSLEEGNLHSALSHLLHTRQQSLMRSRAPVTTWLLIQIRQIMLLEALASRKKLPINSAILHNIPNTSSLIPQAVERLMRLAIQLLELLVTDLTPGDLTDSSKQNNILAALLGLEQEFVLWRAQFLDEGGILPRPQFPPNERFWNCQCLTMQNVCLLLLRESVAKIAAARADQALQAEYSRLATEAADTLCTLAECFVRCADGIQSKAMSVFAPLYFANQWFEANGDSERAASIGSQIEALKEEIPFISWRALLPFSLPSIYMGG